MKLTDFFVNCASAIKSAVLGSPERSPPPVITLSDDEALQLFAEIRAMEFSHKSERGDGGGCHLRAHAIYEMLAERGVANIEKAWISSPLTASGHPNYLIKSPVEIRYGERSEDFDERGMRMVKDDQPFNVHVAPVITTREGRRLVFDTYFYENPPELEQWVDDFEPYEDGVELKFQLANPDYVYFNEIGGPLPEEGSLRQVIARSFAHSHVKSELAGIASNPVDTPLKAKWLEERRNPQPRQEGEPGAGL